MPRARTVVIRVAAAYATITVAAVVLLALVGPPAWSLVVVPIAAILASAALTFALFTSRLQRIARINAAAQSFASERFDVRVPPADDFPRHGT